MTGVATGSPGVLGQPILINLPVDERPASETTYDPTTASWAGTSIELGVNRHHPSTVLLPDGRLLAA